MIPINFSGADNFVKPEQWTDEQCFTLPAKRIFDESIKGFRIVSFWEPTADELQQILKTGKIIIEFGICSAVQIPISLRLVDSVETPKDILFFKPANEVIPAMEDELSKAWQQPPLDNIIITELFAYMNKKDFDLLADYSLTNPTGIYKGKMWKSCVGGKNYFLKWITADEEIKIELRRIIIN